MEVYRNRRNESMFEAWELRNTELPRQKQCGVYSGRSKASFIKFPSRCIDVAGYNTFGCNSSKSAVVKLVLLELDYPQSKLLIISAVSLSDVIPLPSRRSQEDDR